MKLGDKPLSQMSIEEMNEAIAALRESREALRNEALASKAIREAKGMTGEPKQKRAKQPGVKDLNAELLRMMREDV
jgi:hypothetical protein